MPSTHFPLDPAPRKADIYPMEEEDKETMVKVREDRFELLKKEVSAGLSAFRKLAFALKEIRNRGLYKLDGYDNFRTFCIGKFGLEWKTVRRYVNGAEVIDDVKDTGLRPPARESQTRQLGRLEDADARARAWENAVGSATDGQPIARVVRQAVDDELRDGAAPTKPKAKPPPAPAKLGLADGGGARLKYREGDAFTPQEATRALEHVRERCAIEGVGVKGTAKLQQRTLKVAELANEELRGKKASRELAAVVVDALREGLTESENRGAKAA